MKKGDYIYYYDSLCKIESGPWYSTSVGECYRIRLTSKDNIQVNIAVSKKNTKEIKSKDLQYLFKSLYG